jgi:adenylate cyclase class IV
MDKNIEIEIRGPLSKEKFENLVSFFETCGKKTIEKNRIMIDYSTFLEDGIKDRQKDIRLRVTNGIPEIMVKLGKWGGTEHRKELSVFAKPGEFDKLVEIFAVLGFSKGILGIRKSKVYEHNGVEFSLVEVPGHSYYYEAEKMASKNDDAEKIILDIRKTCEELGLEVFNREQFFEYVDRLNNEANEVFDYAVHTSDYFKNRFNL